MVLGRSRGLWQTETTYLNEIRSGLAKYTQQPCLWYRDTLQGKRVPAWAWIHTPIRHNCFPNIQSQLKPKARLQNMTCICATGNSSLCRIICIPLCLDVPILSPYWVVFAIILTSKGVKVYGWCHCPGQKFSWGSFWRGIGLQFPLGFHLSGINMQQNNFFAPKSLQTVHSPPICLIKGS